MSTHKTPTAKDNVSDYSGEHLLVLAITVTLGAISALSLFYHVWDAATFNENFKPIFAGLSALFAFGMAVLPAALAKPHGEAIEAAPAQGSLTLVVIMVMLVDGALQWHAVEIITKAIQVNMPAWWVLAPIIGAYQCSMFMSRGALAASSSEQRELLAAEAERMAAIESRERIERMKAEREEAEREERNRIRREKYAEKQAAKSGNVYQMR